MTNLERLLEQSKKIRDAAYKAPWDVGYHSFTVESGDMKICDIRGWGYLTGKGIGALGLDDKTAKLIQDSNAKFIAHSRNTHEIKDQMIAIMYEALMDCVYLMSGSSKVAPITDAIVLERSRTCIDQVEQLAAQALGDK